MASIRGFGHLEGLPEAIFKRLYQQPATSLAIFRRMLPNLAKTFVMAMLYNPNPITSEDFDVWTRQDNRSVKDEALAKLRQLHLLIERNGQFTLDQTFREQFKIALTGGGHHESFGLPCDTEDKNKVDIAFLDHYATEQWETMLHFMVGNDVQASKRPSAGVIRLLLHGKLMEAKRAGDEPAITQLGFSFLLQDVNSQVWTLLLQYLDMAEQLRMDPVDILHFLFMLGSLELGQDYSLSNLSPTQRGMLEDLRDYGVIYQRKSSSRRFYPTRLATALTSEVASLQSTVSPFQSSGNKEEDNGFLIVETNYRLYAYTSSPLQIAILNLFSRLISRFPNLVTARVTRDTIRQAINKGITADQIIDYMTANAHPQLRKNNPVLPPTVVDQIRLWQIEGERMKATPGFLFKDLSHADFGPVSKYASDLGVLVWKNKEKGTLFASSYDALAAYLKKRATRP